MGQFTELEKDNGNKYVKIDDHNSVLLFKIQNGLVGKVGENGCQINELGKVWLDLLKQFNKRLPCAENELAIINIEHALDWQRRRDRDRQLRKVEGSNKS